MSETNYRSKTGETNEKSKTSYIRHGSLNS
jgi:hypothetical protein